MLRINRASGVPHARCAPLAGVDAVVSGRARGRARHPDPLIVRLGGTRGSRDWALKEQAIVGGHDLWHHSPSPARGQHGTIECS